MRFFVVLLCGLFLLTGAARAEDTPPQTPAMPTYNEMTEEEFVSQAELRREEPYGNSHLTFEVFLPKEWQRADTVSSEGKKGNELHNTNMSGLVTRYYSLEQFALPSLFEVSTQELEYNISVKDWFMDYLFSRGYTLQAFTEHSPSSAEAFYVRVDDDTPYIVRVRVLLNGKRVVIVSHSVPEGRWMKERGEQERIINSFHFTNIADDSFVIASQTFNFLDIMQIHYPIGWRLNAPRVDDIEEIEARLISTQDGRIIDGEIYMLLLSRNFEISLSQEVTALKETLADKKLKAGNLIANISEDYKKPAHVKFLHAESYEAVALDAGSNISPHEFWIGVMAGPDYYYFISMLTPSRDIEGRIWSENADAFRVVLEGFNVDL
jgi:hypothetical protein